MPELSPVVRITMAFSIVGLIAIVFVYHVLLGRYRKKNDSKKESAKPRAGPTSGRTSS